MSGDFLLGIVLIIAAYGLTWFFLLKSRLIIEEIDKNKFKSIREIKEELKI